MNIISVIKEGRLVKGYIVNCNGVTKQFTKQQVIDNAKQIDNVGIQWYNGKPIIRVKDSSNKNIKSKQNVKSSTANSIANNIAMQAAKSSKESIIKALNTIDKGTPVKVETAENRLEQCIYLGVQEVQNQKAHCFFNGRGVNGYFALSEKFILSNKDVNIIFNNNDPTETTFLLNYIKKGPFNLNI